jgi:hypothetical protein
VAHLDDPDPFQRPEACVHLELLGRKASVAATVVKL